MNPFVAAVALGLLSGAGSAEARLGETLAQCVERYGPVEDDRQPSTVKESDPKACKFSKDGFTAFIEFRGGIAWRIVFRKAGMTATDAESLLKANMSDGGWGPAMRINGQDFRLSADRRRIAVHTPAADKKDVPTLEIASRDYGTANYAAYLAKVNEAVNQLKERRKAEGLRGF